MKVVTIESRQLGVLNCHRVARVSRNNDILADLRRMCQNARETVENTLAELDGILSRSGHREALDGGMAEIGGKHECVIHVATATEQEIITPGALQRAGVACGEDHRARARLNCVARAIKFLGLDRVKRVGQMRIRQTPGTIARRGDRAQQ